MTKNISNKENREVYLSGIMSNLNSLASKLEQLASKAKTVKEPGESTALGKVLTAHKDMLAKIKDESKKTKEEIVKTIKSVDVFEAAKIVTSVCMSPDGADDSYRQKMARRRSTLKKSLETSFPDYDFRNDKIGNRAIITPVIVGNPFTRQANSILAGLDDLRDLGYDMPKIDRDNLATSLEQRAGTKLVYSDKPVDDNVPAAKDMLAVIDAIMAGATTAKTEEMKEKKAA